MPPTSVIEVELCPQIICRLSFNQSQPDSESFPSGTLVFFPSQNQLPLNYIWLALGCSEITHGLYGSNHGHFHIPSNPVQPVDPEKPL